MYIYCNGMITSNVILISVFISFLFIACYYPVLMQFSPRSEKVQRLAQGLSPCNLRVGGSTADFLQFQPPGHKNRKQSYSNTVDMWRLTNFTMSGKYLFQNVWLTSTVTSLNIVENVRYNS